MAESITRAWAKDKFMKMVDRINHSPTTLNEYLDASLAYKENMLDAIEQVPHGNVIWQHTPRLHAVCCYIEQGEAYAYSRKGIDLYRTIRNGINNVAKAKSISATDMEHEGFSMKNGKMVEKYFDVAWNTANKGHDIGLFPKTTGSASSSARAGGEFYIVRQKGSKPNPDSVLPQRMKPNVDRTHLIPVTVTGIEKNKAVLIMFDNYLNQVTLNNFENKMLRRIQKYQDVIWWTIVTRNEDYELEWYYVMYNPDGTILDTLHVTDDRWNYIWTQDPYQEHLIW